MRIKILDSQTQQINESDASRVTVFANGQEFIITADAGGLVIKSNRDLVIVPDSRHMIHLKTNLYEVSIIP